MEISISIVEVGAQIIRLSASGTNANWHRPTFAPVNDSFVNDSLLQTKPLFSQPLS